MYHGTSLLQFAWIEPLLFFFIQGGVQIIFSKLLVGKIVRGTIEQLEV